MEEIVEYDTAFGSVHVFRPKEFTPDKRMMVIEIPLFEWWCLSDNGQESIRKKAIALLSSPDGVIVTNG